MLFRRKIYNTLKTNGYYHFRHKRKTDQGKPIQIDYTLLFKELSPSDSEYKYFAYINIQIDKNELDIGAIKSAYRIIHNSNDLESNCPENFEQMLCKVDNEFIEFIDDRLLEDLKMGQKQIFKGMVGENCIILMYIMRGFYHDGSPASVINFNDSVFKFHEFKFL